MKRLFLLTMIVLCASVGNPGFGQTHLLDSLYARMHESSLTDSARLFARSEYSFRLIYNHPDSAEALLNSLLEEARRLDIRSSEADILANFGSLSQHRGNIDRAEEYLEQSYAIAMEYDIPAAKLVYFNNRGLILMTTGKNQEAIKYYKEALRIGKEEGHRIPQYQHEKANHNTLHNIALCYSNVRNHEMALQYYRESLGMRMLIRDTISMLYSYINMGSLFMDIEENDSAVKYFQLSRQTAERLEDLRVMGYADINMVPIYLDMEEFDNALAAARSAQEQFRKSGNAPMEDMGYLSESLVYLKMEDYQKALDLASVYRDTSEVPENIGYLSRYYDRMYEAHKGLGEYDKALEFLELKQQRDASRDDAQAAEELERFESEKRALQDSIQAATERHELVEGFDTTVAKKNKQRNWLIGGGVLALIVAVMLFLRWRRTRKAKEVSESILKNVLPEEITAEIREKGKANAKHFDQATILFSDFKGFTAFSEKTSPEELVKELDTCFEAFDGIAEKYGIEKIKTIGDAYMAAGGLPDPDRGKPDEVVLAAMEMQAFIKQRAEQLLAEGKPAFEMRVGIHTGPVVAGIVGVKKFQYDVWGDTVNTASRMESSGETGRVNVSQSTYEQLRELPGFVFQSRGKVEAKGKGEMEMYFVEAAQSDDSTP